MTGIWFRWVAPLAILLLGVVLLVAWLAYELAFAGIPYQDPTPTQAAEYARHQRVASAIWLAGLLATAAGVLGLGLSLALAAVRRGAPVKATVTNRE